MSGIALPRMRIPPPDGSRDPRTEDPTNIWFVHLVGRLLLPAALRLRISANALSLAGLAFGIGAAFAYLGWPDWRMASLGFVLCIGWLIADGMDGMVARATGSTSATGRILDGICDHAVFAFLYLFLAWSIDSYILASFAAVAHAFQSTLYESERGRFHRRIRGDSGGGKPPVSRNPLVQLYDSVAGSLDRLAEPLDREIERADGQAGDLRAIRSACRADASDDGSAQQQHARDPHLPRLPGRRSALVLVVRAGASHDRRRFWDLEPSSGRGRDGAAARPIGAPARLPNRADGASCG